MAQSLCLQWRKALNSWWRWLHDTARVIGATEPSLQNGRCGEFYALCFYCNKKEPEEWDLVTLG